MDEEDDDLYGPSDPTTETQKEPKKEESVSSGDEPMDEGADSGDDDDDSDSDSVRSRGLRTLLPTLRAAPRSHRATRLPRTRQSLQCAMPPQ